MHSKANRGKVWRGFYFNSEEGFPLFGLEISSEDMYNSTRRSFVKLQTRAIYISIMFLAFAHHYKTEQIRSVMYEDFVFLNYSVVGSLCEKCYAKFQWPYHSFLFFAYTNFLFNWVHKIHKLSHLKHSGNFVIPAVTVKSNYIPTEAACVFYIIRINTYYFIKGP